MRTLLSSAKGVLEANPRFARVSLAGSLKAPTRDAYRLNVATTEAGLVAPPTISSLLDVLMEDFSPTALVAAVQRQCQ